MLKKRMEHNTPFKEQNIKYVTIEGKEPICFSWGINSFGFGTTTFFYEDDKLKCDNETLSKDSIKKILCALVDEAEFIDK